MLDLTEPSLEGARYRSRTVPSGHITECGRYRYRSRTVPSGHVNKFGHSLDFDSLAQLSGEPHQHLDRPRNYQ